MEDDGDRLFFLGTGEVVESDVGIDGPFIAEK